jgi:WD repeat-containing protein 20
VLALSLKLQLAGSPSTSVPAAMAQYNADSVVNRSRCVAVAWIPGSRGLLFLSAHHDGGVYIHRRTFGGSSSGDGRPLARVGAGATTGARSVVTTVRPPGEGVTAAAVSPNGAQVAVASADGVLRVYDIDIGGSQLACGFKV